MRPLLGLVVLGLALVLLAPLMAGDEAARDKEYLARVPPFKPDTFAGRKGKSERVVAMELFTGAQCPCVGCRGRRL
jgi:hypothetical protein